MAAIRERRNWREELIYLQDEDYLTTILIKSLSPRASLLRHQGIPGDEDETFDGEGTEAQGHFKGMKG